MNGLIETLLRAEAARPLFVRAGAYITAGEIRAMAAHALPRIRAATGPMFLHTTSAARFCAGLLAGAAADKEIALPAHTQGAYLAELGCTPDALVTDGSFDGAADEAALTITVRDPVLVLFTSGSTSMPKRIEKNLSRLEREAHELEKAWGAQASHVVATVSHQHIYGMLFRVVWPVLSGRTADDVAAAYWEDIEAQLGGATLISSPAHLTRLPPRDAPFSPPALTFSSGQLLPYDDAQRCITAFGGAVIEVLGSTESGGIAWRQQTTRDALWTPFAPVRVSSGMEDALIVRSPYLQDDAPLDTGDVAEFHADGRFRLRPRGDRVVKIDGKRVSLTRVEQCLVALTEIEAAAALTLPERRDGLAAMIVLTPAGQERLDALGAFRLSRHLRAVAAATMEPPERPKHWRFVDSIPTDSQGKRILSTLRAQFAAPDPLEALELDVRSQTETEAVIAFTLPPELIFFQGHFESQAILPGVSQVHLAVLFAQKLWGVWPPDANLQRLKFRRVLTPGNDVVLTLKRTPANGRVYFSYAFGDIIASEGEIGGIKP